ncbi:MAG: sulfatase-like hydrolase/transferase, partial [Armatimonadota bacterium]
MNIIVIMTDSLRADHCSCYPMCVSYNGRKVSTPNMERLAAEGTVFEHAYGESLPTIPARTTLWTGRVGFPFRGWQPFEPSDYLLAEVLWDKGFTSALITDT